MNEEAKSPLQEVRPQVAVIDSVSSITSAIKWDSVSHRPLVDSSQDVTRAASVLDTSALRDVLQSLASTQSSILEAANASNSGLKSTFSRAFELHRELVKSIGPISNTLLSVRNAIDSLSGIQQEIASNVISFQKGIAEAARQLSAPYLQFLETARKASESLVKFPDPFLEINKTLTSVSPDILKSHQEIWSQFTTAYQAKWTGVEKKVFKIFAQIGVVGLESHLTQSELIRIVSIYEKRGRVGVQKAIFIKFKRNKHQFLRRMVRSWWHVPYMKKRRSLVRSAIKAHQSKQFELSIPTLLPLIDGLAAEITSRTVPLGKKKTIYTKDVAIKFNEQEGEFSSACIEQVVTALIYKNYDFVGAKRAPSSVNRHGILHGRIVNYGNELNSYRVIFLLDVMVKIAGTNNS